jgi:hypothetical protein
VQRVNLLRRDPSHELDQIREVRMIAQRKGRVRAVTERQLGSTAHPVSTATRARPTARNIALCAALGGHTMTWPFALPDS